MNFTYASASIASYFQYCPLTQTRRRMTIDNHRPQPGKPHKCLTYISLLSVVT